MSLNIKLYLKKHVSYDNCQTWTEERENVFTANITHNLNIMAMDAGIYYEVWRPEENLILQAKDLIGILKGGIAKLKAEPERYIKLNPENGWGSYDTLLRFLEGYLTACQEYPNAFVEAER